MVRHVAQAQAQRQTEVTAQESLQVVRSLLRVSVFHVSYLRGLFGEKNFKGMDMDNLEGMTVKILQPTTPESKRLIDWVEKGVYDALRLRYLKTLIYGIAVDEAGASLLEEYKFSFDFEDSGIVIMQLDDIDKGKSKGKTSAHPVGSYESVKFQVIRLMRMLVQICNTLDAVPEERYLFMRLQYHENTPEEYEPPGFKAADEALVGHFDKKPFTMKIGAVNTKHHTVVLKVLSALDACNEDDASDEDKSMQNSTLPGGITGITDSDRTADNENDMQIEEAGAASSQEENYQAVVQFCSRRKQVAITDIMSAFVDVQQKTLDAAILPQLLREGVLATTDQRDTYKVIYGAPDSKAPAAQADPSDEGSPAKPRKSKAEAVAVAATAEQMEEMSVRPGDALTQEVACGRKRSILESLNAQLPNDADDGSAKTSSGVKTMRVTAGDGVSTRLRSLAMGSMQDMQPEPSQPQVPVFFESQQSRDVQRTQRKTSMVQQPIRQTKKYRVKSTAAASRS